MEYLAGIVLALAVSSAATLVGLDRDRAFYPTILAVIAFYYVLFAVIGESASALAIESLALAVFLVAAALGYRRNLWLVVAALCAHGFRFKSRRSGMVADVLSYLRRNGCCLPGLATSRITGCRTWALTHFDSSDADR
jgi:hypothetical protein